MMGTLSPSGGCIRIDQNNIYNFDTSSIRRQIIYLPQTAIMFHGSILDNLTMFRGDSHAHAAMQMSERLGLHDIIGRMPQGYNTRIEHAANDGLSDSIRQRIALARALTLVDEPRLILFDEANGHLNDKSNELLLKILGEYKGTCSMVIVSHHPAYLKICDRGYTIQDKTLVPKPLSQRETAEDTFRMIA